MTASTTARRPVLVAAATLAMLLQGCAAGAPPADGTGHVAAPASRDATAARAPAHDATSTVLWDDGTVATATGPSAGADGATATLVEELVGTDGDGVPGPPAGARRSRGSDGEDRDADRAAEVDAGAADEGDDGDDGDERDAPATGEAAWEAGVAAEAAAWLRAARPAGVTGLRGVAVDVDDDRVPELVLTGVRDGAAWVALASRGARGYRLVDQDRGGPAARVGSVHVTDVNADDVLEVVVAAHDGGLSSLALWSVRGNDRLRPLRARGGCHAGSHVYGVVGADLVAGPDGFDVVATCRDAPLRVGDWSSDRWRWERGAYRVQRPPAEPPGRDDDAGAPGRGERRGAGGAADAADDRGTDEADDGDRPGRRVGQRDRDDRNGSGRGG